jgi:hypothetical protein
MEAEHLESYPRISPSLSAKDISGKTILISVHPGAVKTDMGRKSGLEGVFPSTNPELAADFTVWTTTTEEEASCVGGLGCG